ncbi:MAG: PKD domain-containing protein [Agriterribacter sp.]
MIKKPTFFRIDEKVFFTMTGLCVLALIVLAFQYANKETCAPIKILFSDSLIAGNIIQLKAETQGGKKFEWNFGDGIEKEERTNTTTHIFKTAGSYSVHVSVNNSCDGTISILVKEAPLVINSSLMPIIEAPDTVSMGVPVTFTDLSTTSTSWEWFFGETNTVDKTTQEATYTFNTPGSKTVVLRVNGRAELTRSKYMYVVNKSKNTVTPPKPATPKPPVRPTIKDAPQIDKTLTEQIEEVKPAQPAETPKPKAPDVSTEDLATMIRAIAAGDKGPDVFSPYICSGKEIKVAYNNNVITFTKFCEELKALKKKKIKKLAVWRNVNAQTNCIESMVVTLETKKSILGIFK